MPYYAAKVEESPTDRHRDNELVCWMTRGDLKKQLQEYILDCQPEYYSEHCENSDAGLNSEQFEKDFETALRRFNKSDLEESRIHDIFSTCWHRETGCDPDPNMHSDPDFLKRKEEPETIES